MTATLEILTGRAGSGKTSRLLEVYRSALREARREGRPGRTLWLAPTKRLRRAVLTALMDDSLPACFRPNVFTFDEFAERLLRFSDEPIRRLGEPARRSLLREIVDDLVQQGRLPHFAPIAGTSGFLDLALNWIAELKRDEIWPEEFVRICRKHRRNPKDRELARIYGDYQKWLHHFSLYDGQGRFWAARAQLQRGVRAPFEDLSLVVADGFTDFTAPQYRILQQLAHSVDRLLVSLPLESPLKRTELFAKSAVAADRLRSMSRSRTGTWASLPELSQSPSERLALEHIAEFLFANPRSVPRLSEADGVEIVGTTGTAGEAEHLADRIKRLLFAGIAPEDIVVVWRTLDESADRLRKTLSASGIPAWCESGPALSRAPVVRALFSVLQMELEDWRFERLMAVLDSNFVRPDWPEWKSGRAARDVAAQLRRLKLHGGRSTILRALKNRVDRLNDRIEEAGPEADAKTRADRDQAAAARDVLQRLAEATEPLRQTAPFAEWVERLLQLGRELGIAPKPFAARRSEATTAQHEEEDVQVWTAFRETVTHAAHTHQLLPGETRTIPFAEFARRLQDLLQSVSLPPTGDEAGKVRILDAASVRGLQVPYLFVAGLTESSFPRRHGDEGLYTDGERHRLHELGLPVGHRASRNRDEMLLFYQVVTCARSRLVLSYPAVNDKGEPLFPSPYLAALQDLFEPGGLPVDKRVQLDPLPDRDRLLSRADLRLAATEEVRENRPGLFRSLLEADESAPTARNVLAAVDVAVHRFHTRGFTHYEGMLQDGRNQRRLRDRFTPEYEFSATQLESYAGCPFQFWLSELLHVEPLESPYTATDHRRRGVLIHQVLARIHRELDGGRPDAMQDIAARFRELVDEELGRSVRESELQRALTRIEHRLLDDWAAAYGTQWSGYREDVGGFWDAPPAPAHLEVPFGNPHEESTDSEQPRREPLVIGTGPQQTRVCGRIDRIDVGTADGKPVYTVIDYKSGRGRRFNTDDVRTGRAIQLALYTLAVQRLQMVGDEAVPFQMGYWNLRETGFEPGLKTGRRRLQPLDRAVLESLETMLDDVVPRLAAGIREGQFPVFSQDPQCTGYCPYRTVCRVNQVRPLQEALDKRFDLPVQFSEGLSVSSPRPPGTARS